jgi:4-amino-4-deoxy-L-arabinose transferase-like glycosyltransferase
VSAAEGDEAPAEVVLERGSALLVLFLVAGAYSLTRALESGSTKWLLLAFSFVGFGFLAKMLQALLVVPAFGAVYLFAGPPKLGKRVWQLALGVVAMLVSAGWWIAAVQLTPASARPYIGGSQNNSLWNLMFGYNGFGRLTGDEIGSVGGGTRGGGRWGATGLLRMFNNQFGGQISWLLPAALILLAAGLLFTLSAPRTDRTRAAFLLWGGWLFVTGVAFSLGQGIIHAYYTVALAPAIGALVGMGAVVLWQRRENLFARLFMAATVLVTVWWSVRLLDRAADWYPWLRPLIVVGGIGVTIAILAWRSAWSRASVALAVGAAVVFLAGPGAWAIATASEPHSGAIPSTGPSLVSRTVAFRLGPRLPLNGRGFPIAPPGGLANRASPFNGQNNPGGGAFGAFGGGRQPSGPGTGPSAGGRVLTPPASGASGGSPGGLLDASSPSDELTELLKSRADDYRWVAATVGANSAAGYQLATDEPVMAIGGFNGTDPTPTLAQFEAYVANGDIHYFVGGRTIGGAGGSSSQIAVWVQTHFASTTLGAVRLYDLTTPQ